jgi:hypothetical protein
VQVTAIAGRRTLYGIALVCLANLLLEVTLTRIFSATMFYHFTFLAIALALFGLAASGVYIYVRSERFTVDRLTDDLVAYSRRFAAATIVALVYVLANPIDILFVTGTSRTPLFTKRTLMQLLLLNGVSALPFFFAGMVVALAVAHYRRQIDRVYFFDLAGAGIAALLCGPLLGLLGAPTLVCLVAALATLGAALFRTPRGKGWIPLVATWTLVAANLLWAVISVPTVKGVKAERTLFEKWNVFSRVTVDDQREIKIDASASTRISRIDETTPAKVSNDITALAHATLDPPADRALIIGPGGGRDVVHALVSGAKGVTGVEVNPIIANSIMKERFAETSGNLYADPRVRVVADEGRSFIRRTSEHYDFIQASLVDTWAATAAGAFALTENTLYTIEAFDDYFERLTDRGVVTMTRWDTGEHGESARLLILAAAALERRGIPPSESRRHIYYAVKDGLGTLIAKRTPFTPAELDRLDRTTAAARERIVVSPRTNGSTVLERYLDEGAASEIVQSQIEDLSPPTDDRPFFFYPVKGSSLFSARNLSGAMNNPALWIIVSCAAVGGLTLAFILFPLLERRAVLRGGDRPATARRLATLAYFAVLGAAFITIEIALLQKLTFFLGHPSNALLVVLVSILLGTAVGARLSGRTPAPRRLEVVTAAGIGLAVACVLVAWVVTPALRAWVAWPWGARALLAALLMGLFGVMMGFLMPLGIGQASERDPELVPWGWGLNGAMSVLGTVAATVVAIHVGFTATLLAGGALYLLAPLAFFVARRHG